MVLAGGRSSRMGTPKAALEWHGSTLLRRTVGILARATGGPVVVVRAPGQELPALPPDVEIISDPREGKGPVQGLAAGLGALADRADVAFVSSTDMPFLHPAFVRRVLRAVHEGADVGLPVARGYPQPLAAAYRTKLAATSRTPRTRRTPPARLPVRAVHRHPAGRAIPEGRPGAGGARPRTWTPWSTSTSRTSTERPGPSPDPRSPCSASASWLTGTAPRRLVSAATVAEAAAAAGVDFGGARDGGAQRGPDHPGRPDTAGGGRHGLLPVRRRGRLRGRR